MTYTVMVPAPHRRLAMGPALAAGATACADATATKLGSPAVSATLLRGTIVDRWAPATGGPPTTSTFLAVVRPDGCAWAQLGGPPWAAHDVDSAAAALEAALDRAATRG